MNVMPNKMVKAGQVVFAEGDAPTDGLYYICYGQVEVSRMEPDGTRTLATLGEGDVFGEMAIINSGARNATVKATQDSGFFTVNRENFQHKVEQLEPVMRGVFRVLVLSLRDFLAHRDAWLKANQPPPPPEAVHYTPDANRPIGGLASGEARKLQF